MSELATDPDRVYELLAITLMIGVVVAGLLAILYMRLLGRFFDELRANEPDVWMRIGSPRVVGMVVLPLPGFRRYYAFFPVLRQRATESRSEYRHAAPAYRMLKAGLTMMLLLFGLAAFMVVWIS